MKKLLILLLFLLLCSCAEESLSDRVTAVLAETELPAGSILFYGRRTDGTLTRETLCEYLGLDGYPDFAEKIEEMVLYSSLGGEFAELCVLRLYDRADRADAKTFLTRRVNDITRTLTVMGKPIPAAVIRTRGNTVALAILPDNTVVEEVMRQ